MPENFWYTILGGFLAGGFGILLFFIQRWKESKDQQQNLMFRIYNLIKEPFAFHKGVDSVLDYTKIKNEIEALSFLLKDTKLAKKIYFWTQKRTDKEEIIKTIKSKLNKKLLKEIQ